MPRAVSTTRVDLSYGDLPEERYHFPRTYLNAVRAALGNWIVQHEPRRSSAHLVQPLTETIRDRVFSTAIKPAYDNTSAISRLRIINGGGRVEAQAAHIRPLARQWTEQPLERRRAN